MFNYNYSCYLLAENRGAFINLFKYRECSTLPENPYGKIIDKGAGVTKLPIISVSQQGQYYIEESYISDSLLLSFTNKLSVLGLDPLYLEENNIKVCVELTQSGMNAKKDSIPGFSLESDFLALCARFNATVHINIKAVNVKKINDGIPNSTGTHKIAINYGKEPHHTQQHRRIPHIPT